jgi:hypothetical protein
MTPSSSITQPWTASLVDVTAAITVPARSSVVGSSTDASRWRSEHDAERLTEPGERIKKRNHVPGEAVGVHREGDLEWPPGSSPQECSKRVGFEEVRPASQRTGRQHISQPLRPV